ncbi:DUF397 domain-containing protein [Actinomadura rubrisoli]|uniref:DUF397 domain-containing protein n=1 Tax=Actinomadura rubrisoli TaxID=2530368 RepID=A0A4V2YSF0_9ACTN|nr:DUF397 domain-containing protein [Actinomadura rubrisoli]TDD69367.1 DUF397 domain-containing protein [Actinomadura rubrisoli]
MTSAERYIGWRKSSYSGTGNNCVEAGLACEGPDVGVRDSAAGTAGPILKISAVHWAALIAEIKEERYIGR